MFHQRFGAGVPVVTLLPQSTGPGGRDRLMAGMSDRYEVIHCDPTRSPDEAPVPDSMSGLAERVVQWSDSVDMAPVPLVCHSTGCGIGLSLAMQAPTRVRALVLSNPWTHGDWHLTTMQNLRKAAARALDAYQYAHFNASVLFPPAYRREHEDAFEHLARNALPPDADDIARRLDTILAFDARPHLARILCPVLLLTAPDDQLMPSWFAHELAMGIPGAELVEFDGGGHMLPETRTAAFTKTVLEFLERTA